MWAALPMTSAGRFWPWGFLGLSLLLHDRRKVPVQIGTLRVAGTNLSSFAKFVIASLIVSAVGVAPLVIASSRNLPFKGLALAASGIAGLIWVMMIVFGFALYGRRTAWLFIEAPAALF